MSDMFGGKPPAPAPTRRASAPKPKAPPAPVAAQLQDSRQAAELQAMQVKQADLPEAPTCTESQVPLAPRLYGQVTLHDGRQVDSGSAEWQLECLARTLLQLGAAEREAWILGYGTEAARVELRLRIQAVKAARR